MCRQYIQRLPAVPPAHQKAPNYHCHGTSEDSSASSFVQVSRNPFSRISYDRLTFSPFLTFFILPHTMASYMGLTSLSAKRMECAVVLELNGEGNNTPRNPVLCDER